MAAFWQQLTALLRTQSRNMQVGLGCAVLIGACTLCSVGYAIGAGANSTSGANTSPTATSRAAGPAPSATPALPTNTPKPKAWVTIQHFTGTDNQQTPTFNLPDGSRIVWSASAANEFGGSFSITSYNADGTYGDLIANTSTPPKASGTFNIHGSQDIYLKIDTFGCTYDIAVQEYR